MTRTTNRMRSPRRCRPHPITATSDQASQCLRPSCTWISVRTTARMRGPFTIIGAALRPPAHPDIFSPGPPSNLDVYKPSRFSSTRSQVGPLPVDNVVLVACRTRAPSLNDRTSSLDCVFRHAHPALCLLATHSMRESLDFPRLWPSFRETPAASVTVSVSACEGSEE
ncbi:hypothetical protein B0H13DRAFT_2050309 [Mycena leptocephala]|nr:hypothetical protein B0H13DRAFT_2050309 [Mycena leptocephala]